MRKMLSSKVSWLITAAITAVLLSATTTEAQPSCASKLVPCASYLNSTKPPASCCDPLREAVTKDLQCLCKLYENPTFLSTMGINVTQAIGLPKYCNIPGDVTACKGRMFNPDFVFYLKWVFELGLNFLVLNLDRNNISTSNLIFFIFVSLFIFSPPVFRKNKSGMAGNFV